MSIFYYFDLSRYYIILDICTVCSRGRCPRTLARKCCPWTLARSLYWIRVAHVYREYEVIDNLNIRYTNLITTCLSKQLGDQVVFKGPLPKELSLRSFTTCIFTWQLSQECFLFSCNACFVVEDMFTLDVYSERPLSKEIITYICKQPVHNSPN